MTHHSSLVVQSKKQFGALRTVGRLPLVLCGLGPWGFGFCRTGLWAPPPRRRAWRRPRYPQEKLVRARASFPEISRLSHEVLPTVHRARALAPRASSRFVAVHLRQSCVAPHRNKTAQGTPTGGWLREMALF
jgi:hypothetical protein